MRTAQGRSRAPAPKIKKNKICLSLWNQSVKFNVRCVRQCPSCWCHASGREEVKQEVKDTPLAKGKGGEVSSAPQTRHFNTQNNPFQKNSVVSKVDKIFHCVFDTAPSSINRDWINKVQPNKLLAHHREPHIPSATTESFARRRDHCYVLKRRKHEYTTQEQNRGCLCVSN